MGKREGWREGERDKYKKGNRETQELQRVTVRKRGMEGGWEKER